jgi:hypothetical protein
VPALTNTVHESLCRDVAGGMSREAAWRAHGFGSRNSTRFFKREKIAARVSELQAEFNQGAKVHAAYLTEKLLTVVNADVGQFLEVVPYSGRLRLRDVTKLPPEQRRAISELVIDKNGRTSIKLESKTHALDSLLKMIGCGGPSVAVNVNAQATASAATGPMTDAEIARRMSWVIESAAEETIDAEMINAPAPPPPAGELLDAAPAPAAVPAGDRVTSVLRPVVGFAQETTDDEARELAARLRRLAQELESDLERGDADD